MTICVLIRFAQANFFRITWVWTCPSSGNQKARDERFGSRICFRHQVEGQIPTLMRPLGRSELNHWTAHVGITTAVSNEGSRGIAIEGSMDCFTLPNSSSHIVARVYSALIIN
jgi:hypothetical protein